jgi:ferredoxin
VRWHGGPKVPNDAPTITVTFLQPDKTRKEVQARVGESLLQTAHRNEIDLEGACEGGESIYMMILRLFAAFAVSLFRCPLVCACSTCHLIMPQDLYDILPDPSEDEEDMLE